MSTGLTEYQLLAEFLRLDATGSWESDSMASLPLANVDCVPALEWVWERVTRDPRPPIVLDQFSGTVEPSWDVRRRRPYVSGMKVALGDDSSAYGTELPLDRPKTKTQNPN